MKLAWFKVDRGCYESVTGRTRYRVVARDFEPVWDVLASGRRFAVADTLRDGKVKAQAREDAIRRHLRTATGIGG